MGWMYISPVLSRPVLFPHSRWWWCVKREQGRKSKILEGERGGFRKKTSRCGPAFAQTSRRADRKQQPQGPPPGGGGARKGEGREPRRDHPHHPSVAKMVPPPSLFRPTQAASLRGKEPTRKSRQNQATMNQEQPAALLWVKNHRRKAGSDSCLGVQRSTSVPSTNKSQDGRLNLSRS